MCANRRLPAALALAVLLWAAPATAGVVSTAGAMTIIPAPPSTLEGALESDASIFLFAEQADLTLATPLAVDVNAPGSWSNSNVPPVGSAQIPAGTELYSYFMHFDTSSENVSRTGSVTFDTYVLGIVLYEPTLAASDGVVGNPGTLYPPSGSDPNRGADFGPDMVALDVARRTVTVTLKANKNQLDHLRILLAKAPEPSTGVMLYAGLLALGFARRRRSR